MSRNSPNLHSILKIVSSKTVRLWRQCFKYTVYSKMNITQTLSGLFSFLLRNRRLVILGLGIFTILLYLWPSWFRQTTSSTFDLTESCLDSKLNRFQTAVANYDVIVKHYPLWPDELNTFSFVGNGYIGTPMDRGSQLMMRDRRVFSLKIPFSALVSVSLPTAPIKEADVINILDGIVVKVQCLQVGPSCVSVETEVFAHRVRPSLLMQMIQVHNLGLSNVMVRTSVVGSMDWSGSRTTNLTLASYPRMQFVMTAGTIESFKDKVQVAVVVRSVLPTAIEVKASSRQLYSVLTIIKYSDIIHFSYALKQENIIKQEVQQELEKILTLSDKVLREEHIFGWNKLWYHGFGISKSQAIGQINGDRINSTVYHLLSHMRSPLHEVATSSSEKMAVEQKLYNPDRCYSGHYTLQITKLWEPINDLEHLISIATKWMITLEKQGCESMVSSGAEGGLQAIMLSLGSLRFSNNHLELTIHPSHLDRDFFFRRINYGNNTHLNVSIIVGDDNKAKLYLALDRNDKPYYACDAGCLDPPVRLNENQSVLPVKLTKPTTSILYVTSDFEHLDVLKHAIHVKEIALAPPHEHHVMALHRHGHHYGGLPLLFWLSISFLIIIFHLFLIKLVINEYCQISPQERISRARKYNL